MFLFYFSVKLFHVGVCGRVAFPGSLLVVFRPGPILHALQPSQVQHELNMFVVPTSAATVQQRYGWLKARASENIM